MSEGPRRRRGRSTSSASPTRTAPRSRSSPTSSSTRSPPRPSTRTSRSGCSRSCSTTRSAAAHAPASTQAKLFSEKVDERAPALRATGSSQAPRSSSGSSRSPSSCATRATATSSSASADEEAAFYDALAGADENATVDPQLAAIAARARRRHPRRPDRRLGRPRVNRGGDPPQDQAAAAQAQLPAPAAERVAVAAATAQLLHQRRARPGQGALPLLARHRGPPVRVSQPKHETGRRVSIPTVRPLGTRRTGRPSICSPSDE